MFAAWVAKVVDVFEGANFDLAARLPDRATGSGECREADRDRRGTGHRSSRRCGRNLEHAGRSRHPCGDGDRKARCEIARRARENEVARGAMTVPGIGPRIATAIAVLAPSPDRLRKARDFAACLGLRPRQHSTGGQQRLGVTTKMAERSVPRLPIPGRTASSSNGTSMPQPARACGSAGC